MEQQITEKIEGILLEFSLNLLAESRRFFPSKMRIGKIASKATNQLLTLIANHDKKMLTKIEGLVDKEITSKDLSKIIHLDDIKSLYGGGK